MYIEILSLVIEGMICDKCVEKLEKLLTMEPGVVGVSISLADKRADIRYDEAKTSARTLCKLIEKAGYDPMIIDQ
ncbi:heavy metal-associated domain-containing protein [Acetobacteraceae bacterium ESL0709]|nr:heavy metal-associated domain-containing protein [Acetobacteraceae bacterium ESL0697]MDF7677115.1 heavy metal-associated domain-containing protein [Acetobacteraceae bacterium ESL0709]